MSPCVINRQIVELKDGGTVALDWTDDSTCTKPILLIIPGFTGVCIQL